jgi:hypothetical protein
MTRLPQDVPGRQRPWKLCAFAGALIPALSTQAYVYKPTSVGYGEREAIALASILDTDDDGVMSQMSRRNGLACQGLPALPPVPNRKTLPTFQALLRMVVCGSCTGSVWLRKDRCSCCRFDAPHAGCGNAVRPKAAATSTMDGGGRHPHAPSSSQYDSHWCLPSSRPQQAPIHLAPSPNHLQTLFHVRHVIAPRTQTRQPLQC